VHVANNVHHERLDNVLFESFGVLSHSCNKKMS
jgi:hypothetical protein